MSVKCMNKLWIKAFIFFFWIGSKSQFYRDPLKTISPRDCKCPIMVCYKAHCLYILNAYPDTIMSPTNVVRDSWSVLEQPELTPGLQAFHLNLSRRLPHLCQDPYSTGSSPSFGCCVYSVLFAEDCPILIPFVPIWWFFKRINMQTGLKAWCLWDLTYFDGSSITEKLSGGKRTGLFRKSELEHWLSVVSTRTLLLPLYLQKWRWHYLLNRICVHKYVCESTYAQ